MERNVLNVWSIEKEEVSHLSNNLSQKGRDTYNYFIMRNHVRKNFCYFVRDCWLSSLESGSVAPSLWTGCPLISYWSFNHWYPTKVSTTEAKVNLVRKLLWFGWYHQILCVAHSFMTCAPDQITGSSLKLKGPYLVEKISYLFEPNE